MRRCLVLLGLFAAGCAQLIGIQDPAHAVDGGGDPTGDAPLGGGDARPGTADARPAVDAAPGPDARTCGWPFLPTRFDPCDLPETNPETSIGAAVLDTEMGTLKIGDAPATKLRGVERSQSGALRIRVE